MAVRIYIVPRVGSGTATDLWRPKYIVDGIGTNLLSGPSAHVGYGLEPVYLVAADVTNAEHTALAANSDVTAVPANLDATLGANLATVQAKLEAFGIPSGWVTGAMTYRTVVKWVIRLFFISQRLNGMSNVGLLPQGVTLDSTISDLTQTQRDKLSAAAESLGADTSGVTGATTIRAALKALADQLPSPAQILGLPL